MQPNQPFTPTHMAPPNGMSTWSAPGAPAEGPRLDPHLPVHLLRTYGDWAEIACSNGWTAWVDGRVLVPLPTPAASPAAAAPAAYAPPGQYAQPDVYANTGAYAPTGQYPQAGQYAPTGQYAPARAIPPVVAAGSAKPYSFVVPGTTTLPAIIGAVLVVVAAFLAWVDVGGGADTLNAFDVPLSFLWDKESLGDDGIALGAALLVLAAASFLLRHFRGLEQISRIPAALVVAVVGLYLLQMNSLVSDTELSLFDVIGIGVWPALIGGGLLVWGGTTPRRT